MPSALKLLKNGQKREANPFELKYSKTKHSIFNKKVKGEKGKPALTRKRGIQKRQETIGQELTKKTRSNDFQDKRFGEFSKMSMQDKLMTRNKMIAEKKFSVQNLNFETQQLTHSGKLIDTLDAFEQGGLEKVDDSDSGELPKEVVENIHFGGFEAKSKNQVYQEIIQKSKMHKLERKMAKEADEDLTREVDNELLGIRDLLTTNSSVTREDLPPVRRFADGSFRDDQDYDRYVKELIYEKRAQATDRLKTEEEVALEEKAKLEKLEAERLQRMAGASMKAANKRASQADDLDDGLFFDDAKPVEQPLVYQDGKLVNNQIFFKSAKKQKREVEEGVESDDSTEDLESESEESLASDIADLDETSIENEIVNEDMSDSSDEEEADSNVNQADYSNEDQDVAQKVADDTNSLPFIFVAPSSLVEFSDLMKGRSENEMDTIIHRIRVLYNKRLHVDNKQKLETLLIILFEFLEKLPHEGNQFTEKCNIIGKHIIQLSEEFVQIAADYAISRIKDLRLNFSKNDSGVIMPRAPELAFFKTLLLTFPGSDLYHPIITPLILLMAQYLEMALIKSDQDLLSGLKLCENLFITQKLSKRYIPEVFNFLVSTISCFTGNSIDIKPCFLRVKLRGYKECLTSEFPTDLDLNLLLSPRNKVDMSHGQKLALLVKALKVLSDFIRIYSDLPSWIELCDPLCSVLNAIDVTNPTISEKLLSIKNKLNASIASAKLKRVPLELLKRKPIPIKTYTPKFEKHYSVDKKYNPNKEKAEFAKLKFQHKQEFKGAIRELKKDAEFIARAKMEERKSKDADYKRKMDKIMGQLASQEGAMRGYDKEKNKSKRKLQ